ncbi:MAG TPA: alpha/beta fold hydrolase [Caulobacteraceae bacterium]|jgi:homoserine O-acetyltransferase|nr:alpha/beta fold hydrolase [Caulobacteraceae bacterium]
MGLALGLGAAQAAMAQAPAPVPPTAPPPAYGEPRQGELVIPDFHFRSGESLPRLRIHYMTLGTPARDASGRITNAVLILHGTGGSGYQFLRPQFAGELFGPGQLLDAKRYFIILPDDIGHGKSSKPSDGMRMHFPRYDYADMVEAEHAVVASLGVTRLRLIMGTSMGCMHAFMWGETYPQGMDALMPLACLPVRIVGRNRLWRRMVIDVIEHDPAWAGGEYASEPREGLRGAEDVLAIAGSAPQQQQKTLATPDEVDAYLKRVMDSALDSPDPAERDDANDTIYQVDSSRDYDPSANLEAIEASVMWINSADDFINPPELGIAEREAPRLKHGRFILLPIGPDTHGHGTHTWAVAWKSDLQELLERTGRP